MQLQCNTILVAHMFTHSFKSTQAPQGLIDAPVSCGRSKATVNLDNIYTTNNILQHLQVQ